MLQRCNVRPIYPLYFQILAHSSPQRASHNSFHVNHFRTLFSSTEGVPPALWNRVSPSPIPFLFILALAHSPPQRPSHNSFHVNHFRTLSSSTEGVPPTLWNRVSPSPIPFLFILLRNRLHFSALVKNSTLLFSAGSALFAKNTAVWGGVSC